MEPDWAPNRASPSIYTFTVISPLNDLNWRSFLGRPPLSSPPPDGIEALRQQPILITGAGGSIGSALALRLAALAPSMLVLLEASESNLYALQRDWAELQTANPRASCPMAPVLGSVADQPLLDEIFALHAPLIVFHAAAFKHVPLMEEQPLAAISNNVFATQTLTETATAHGARVVLLSTDKAVQPASVMGATKRVAEQIVLSSGGTTLRLANVLASRDSVAEVFTRQIAQGLRRGTMVSYETTLPIGGTRALLPILESGGLRGGRDFDLVFSPERVKSQLVIQRLTKNPKIVGGLTPEAAARAAAFYGEYLSAPVINVGLTATPPKGWKVVFDPKRLPPIPVGGQLKVNVLLTPGAQAIAGDYLLNVSAVGDGVDQNVSYRVTVLTSTLWGVAGIGVILVALLVLVGAVGRFGRR